MVDAALFSLTVKILSNIGVPSLKAAYGRAISIWEATEEIEKLRRTIQTIQASLRDAEKRAETSAEVREWVERTKDVLYEADDFFDEVATNELIKRQKSNTIFKKVQVSVSKFNPVISNDSIAKKVKAIREGLHQISNDMGPFKFVECEYEKSIFTIRRGVQSGWYVEPKHVYGRDGDLETIRGHLLDERYCEESVSVVAIVGIGGMGKTTLSQLVYNDDQILNSFRNRWWAWISKTFDDLEVTGKIFQSMTGECCHNLTMGQLESGIRESVSIGNESRSIDAECKIEDGRFLLVLDDLWEEDHARGKKLRSLLSSHNAKGSMILVTTRSQFVAQAMEADIIYDISGLSWDASWELFQSFAFTRERKNDPNFNNVGVKIINKCASVPLAIKSIASLLYTKRTLREWKQIEEKELSKIQLTDDSIMSALKLSYDHLPPQLKQCFAYCYLFPKDYIFCKEELIYLWIAQGYVKQESHETIEAAGDAYFMELLTRSFFQEAEQDKHVDEIVSCKMHSLMHDLAHRVAGEEFIVLTAPAKSKESISRCRHLSVGYETDDSWSLPQQLLNCSGLRSSLFKYEGSLNSLLLDQLPMKFKLLRALNLGHQKIDRVSSSIGELKHLRYLNLSRNKFTGLPSSMTKLVNLHTLDISFCDQLEALPVDIRRLINLVHLDNKECKRLRHMPPRFGELPCLRRLSYFKVGKAISGGKLSQLDAFARLELTGELMIRFDDNIDDWNGDKCWQLPSTIQVLTIENYPDTRMPHWGQPTASSPSKLVKLQVVNSSAIKTLPSLRLLPNLKALQLSGLDQLDYVEKEGGIVASISLPCLEELKLCFLPNLMGWSREVEAAMSRDLATNNYSSSPHQLPSFPHLLDLKIQHCQNLKSMPLSPSLETLELDVINEDLMLQLLSPTTPPLKTIIIWGCTWLNKFSAQALTSLRFLEFKYCNNLQHLDLAPLESNSLEELVILQCPKLNLWEEKSVVWDSLPNLRLLSLSEIPNEDTLPSCLRNLQTQGKLEIKKPQ